jgi:type II secretory pathway component PulK
MRDREKGAALIWALVLLGFAASLSALLLERGRAVDAGTKADMASLRAHYAAEGGLALARHRLARDPSYAGGIVSVGECEVLVRVERREGGWLVSAQAQPGGTKVEAHLQAGPGLPVIGSRQAR